MIWGFIFTWLAFGAFAAFLTRLWFIHIFGPADELSVGEVILLVFLALCGPIGLASLLIIFVAVAVANGMEKAFNTPIRKRK